MAVATEKRTGLRLPALPKKPSNSMPRGQAERLWLVGGGTVALLLTVIAYFFFISPQRSETSDVRGQVSSASGQNAVLQHKLDLLRQQNQSLPKYRADLRAAHQALPTDSGLSDFLRSLQVLGAQTQTNVLSLSIGNPTPVNPPTSSTSTGAAAEPGANAGAAAGAPAGGATVSPAAGSGQSAGQSATAGVYAMTISAQISGSAGNLERFLDQLQKVQPRAVLISSVNEASGGANAAAGAANVPAGATTLQLTMEAFVAPNAVPSTASSTGPGK